MSITQTVDNSSLKQLDKHQTDLLAIGVFVDFKLPKWLDEPKSLAEAHAAMRRWASETGTGWTPAEIDDVSVYLNRRYYRFRCPTALCGNEQASLAR